MQHAHVHVHVPGALQPCVPRMATLGTYSVPSLHQARDYGIIDKVVTKTDRQEEELKGYAARGGIG